MNIFDDLLTTIVPMPLIWRLKLRKRQRIAVISIFGLGIIADIVGAVRTYYVWTMIYNSYDVTWGSWPISLTAAIEINIGLVWLLTLARQAKEPISFRGNDKRDESFKKWLKKIEANLSLFFDPIDMCIRTGSTTVRGVHISTHLPLDDAS